MRSRTHCGTVGSLLHYYCGTARGAGSVFIGEKTNASSVLAARTVVISISIPFRLVRADIAALYTGGTCREKLIIYGITTHFFLVPMALGGPPHWCNIALDSKAPTVHSESDRVHRFCLVGRLLAFVDGAGKLDSTHLD